jgi:hypothetical protein
MRYALLLGALLSLAVAGCAHHDSTMACCDKKTGGDMKCCDKGSDCCMKMSATTKPSDDHAAHH